MDYNIIKEKMNKSIDNSIDNSIIYSKSPIPTNEFQKTGLLEKNKNELLNIKRQRTSIPLTSPIMYAYSHRIHSSHGCLCNYDNSYS